MEENRTAEAESREGAGEACAFRDSFVMYRSFYESIRKFHELGVIDGDSAARLFFAISELALDGEERELEPIEDAIFTQIRPQVNANRVRAKGGASGGRPRKAQGKEERGDAESKPMVFESAENKKPMVFENEQKEKPNVNANVNENANGIERAGQGPAAAAGPPSPQPSESPSSNSVRFPLEAAGGKPSRKGQGFTPPSVDEVAAYCKERGNGVDPESFVAFYASKGWLVGKSKMKDWRQAVITWERRDKEKAQAQARASPEYPHFVAPERPEMSDEERSALVAALEGAKRKLGAKVIAVKAAGGG